MTFTQMLLVGAIGGVSGVLSLGLVIVLAILCMDAVDWIRDRLHDLRARRTKLRARRADFDACRAIDALPPVHPREPR
ncbi:hypothetical protein ABZX77_40640 [Streptomyces sp. NPDC004237]|uniref:hypothetical protein n=1 Tax=Streptomyces sp. NPDC004237 TaxID=3154455 RepID=UPI0033A09416